jgi:hypothetical protein
MALRRRKDRRAAACAALLASILALALVAIGASSSAHAQAQDPAATAFNILASGQYGTVPPPPDADVQPLMYDGLTPLFDQVTNADLHRYFKVRGAGDRPGRADAARGGPTR